MWNRVRGHFFLQTATTAPGSRKQSRPPPANDVLGKRKRRQAVRDRFIVDLGLNDNDDAAPIKGSKSRRVTPTVPSTPTFPNKSLSTATKRSSRAAQRNQKPSNPSTTESPVQESLPSTPPPPPAYVNTEDGAIVVGHQSYKPFESNIPFPLPGYEDTVVSDDFELNRSWVQNIRRPANLRQGNPDSQFTDSRPFLQAAMIPRQHRANLLFTKNDVLGLRDFCLFLISFFVNEPSGI